MGFWENFKSRKFLLTLLNVSIVLGKSFGWLDVNDDQIWMLITATLPFLGLEGAADIVSRWRYADLAPTEVFEVEDEEETF